MRSEIEEEFVGALPALGNRGSQDTVSVWARYSVKRPLAGAVERVLFGYRAQLSDGTTVQRTAVGTYVSDETGEVFRTT